MGVKIIKPPRQNTFVCCGLTRERAPGAGHHLSAKARCLLVGLKSRVLARALLQFELEALPDEASIMRALLMCYIEKNCYPENTKTVEAFQILSDWKARHVSWMRQPLVSRLPVAEKTLDDKAGDFFSLDITSLVKDWYANRAANYGVLLKVKNEFENNRIEIAGKRARNSQVWPYIHIDYIDAVHPRPRTLDIAIKVVAGSGEEFTRPLNTLVYEYSYIVVNCGQESALCYLQTSADGVHWQTESSVKAVNAGESVSFVPDTISKYSRLSYRTIVDGSETELMINIQGRS